jgi:predicted TPR repeat methyltransferase
MTNENEQSYDTTAKQFIASRRQTKVHALVVQFGDLLKSGDSLLDVGCGAGIPNAKYLADKGFHIIGIDVSSMLLSEARKTVPNAMFVKADIVDFHTNKRFNAILAWDSLFHLKLSEHEIVFRKVYWFLKDNGYLLFTHGGGTGGEITGDMFGQRFSYSTLGEEKTRKLLEHLGFKIIHWEIDDSENGYLIGLVKKSNQE